MLCATHSPVLASLPGARILEVGEWGLRETAWADLELVDHWRRFLEVPQAYLRHLGRLTPDGSDYRRRMTEANIASVPSRCGHSWKRSTSSLSPRRARTDSTTAVVSARTGEQVA